MANELAKRLMARVRELREARKLTQEAFAERAGLSYKYYQAWETGKKEEFRFSLLAKLAKGFGLEPWELLNFESEPLLLGEDPPKETPEEKKPAPPLRHPGKRPRKNA